MNSKRKIIDTLRSADKASVERLMADAAKKDDIFAKVKERTRKDGGYTDVAVGAERYDRKITVTRFASIAAAFVLTAGALAGGAYLIKNKGPNSNENFSEKPGGNTEMPAELTKEDIRRIFTEKGEYQKLSFNYEEKAYYGDSEDPERITKGSCRIDNTAGTGFMTSESSYNDGTNSVINAYCLDYYVVWASDELNGEASHEKTYKIWKEEEKETAMYSVTNPIKYDFQNMIQAMSLRNEEDWKVTDDRYENGRRTLTIEGIYRKAREGEGEDGNFNFSLVMDAETGIPLSQKVYSYDGRVVLSQDITELRFDDEAEAPMTQAEYKKLIIDGGYEKIQNSKFDLDILEGDIPVTTAAVNMVESVNVPVTTEAHTVPDEITEEYLRERGHNAGRYYNSFSADYTVEYAANLAYYEESKDFSTLKGRVRIDNPSMTGEYTEDKYDTDGKQVNGNKDFFLNNIYVYAVDDSIKNEKKWYKIVSIDEDGESMPDRIVFDRCGCFEYINWDREYNSRELDSENIRNISPWTITGDRYENGRRIVSISFTYELLRSYNVYSEYTLNADVDAETGLWLAYDYYEGDQLRTSFRAENYRFNDEAEAPMTAKEVRTYLEDSGYGAAADSGYRTENIG